MKWSLRRRGKDLYSEDDIRIYVELAAVLTGDFQCRLATSVEVVADSGCAYSEKFLDSVHRSLVGCLAFDMCHRYTFFASIRSYSACVPMNRMKTVFIVIFTTAMRR